jgi:hypothetical protein
MLMGLEFRTAGIGYQEDLAFGERAHWSYSGFHAFRKRLAAAIGIKLEEMAGFAQNKAGQPWNQWDGHPLLPLLIHSDCDGELSPAQCGLVAFGLNDIIHAWPEDDYDKIEAKKLFRHLVKCLESGRALEFR